MYRTGAASQDHTTNHKKRCGGKQHRKVNVSGDAEQCLGAVVVSSATHLGPHSELERAAKSNQRAHVGSEMIVVKMYKRRQQQPLQCPDSLLSPAGHNTREQTSHKDITQR